MATTSKPKRGDFKVTVKDIKEGRSKTFTIYDGYQKLEEVVEKIRRFVEENF